MESENRDGLFGGADPPPTPGRKSQEGLDVQDRRRPERIIVPFYVVQEFGALIGPYGLALYLALCFHVGRQRAVWPTMNRLAALIGCSRSSIERAFRKLKQAGLVIVEPCVDSRGQRSNTIYLVDPGSPPPQTAPDVPVQSAPRRHPDGAAPSTSQGGDRNGTGGPLSNGRRVHEGDPKNEVCVHTHTDVSQTENIPSGEMCYLRDLWMSQLVSAQPLIRRQHYSEIVPELEEARRRGCSPEFLRELIEDPLRDRSEWPRQFRIRAIRLKSTKKAAPASAEALAAQRAREAEIASRTAQEFRAAGGFAAMRARLASARQNSESVDPGTVPGSTEQN